MIEATIDITIRNAVGDAVDFVIPIVELMGAAVIVVGVVISFSTYALSELRIRPVAYEHVRLLLGRYLAVGLEFQLASGPATCGQARETRSSRLPPTGCWAAG